MNGVWSNKYEGAGNEFPRLTSRKGSEVDKRRKLMSSIMQERCRLVFLWDKLTSKIFFFLITTTEKKLVYLLLIIPGEVTIPLFEFSIKSARPKFGRIFIKCRVPSRNDSKHIPKCSRPGLGPGRELTDPGSLPALCLPRCKRFSFCARYN